MCSFSHALLELQFLRRESPTASWQTKFTVGFNGECTIVEINVFSNKR